MRHGIKRGCLAQFGEKRGRGDKKLQRTCMRKTGVVTSQLKKSE